LATSRELLSVPGEVVYIVPPLGTPDPRAVPTPQELADYDSVQLSADRARVVCADFALTKHTARVRGRICH
jgi:predicted ATPase